MTIANFGGMGGIPPGRRDVDRLRRLRHQLEFPTDQSGHGPDPAGGDQSVAAAPANNSAWNRQPQAATASTTKPAGDPSALAAPTGNTPQFSNQPTGGITPAGGIAPPAALPAAGSVPAAPASGSGSSTSNLLPIGSSGNAGTPMSAAPGSNKQVVTAAARTTESAPKALPAAPGDDSAGQRPDHAAGRHRLGIAGDHAETDHEPFGSGPAAADDRSAIGNPTEQPGRGGPIGLPRPIVFR